MVNWYDLIKLLRSVAKVRINNRDREFILQFSRKEVPWENLPALASMQGVAGLLYHHLKDLDLLGILPESALRSLEVIYHQTKQHTLHIKTESEELSQRFERAGIQIMGLQGLSVLSAYGDPGLRPLGDLDLMVKEGQKDHLKALLRERGYQNPMAIYPDHFLKDAIKIDIHTHVLNLDRINSRRHLFPEDLNDMWERAIPLFSQHNGLLILDPFDNFIALAAHALKHRYYRLIWLSDLYESLLNFIDNSPEWEEMVIRARFWRQERVVLYAIILVETILGLDIPLQYKRELGINRLRILEKHLLRLRVRGFTSNGLSIGLWLHNVKGVRRKLNFLIETIFPRDDIIIQIYPGNSQEMKSSRYFKRMVQAISKLIENLHKALILSLGSSKYK